MNRLISEDEFGELLRTFERSAFRLEAQPVYAIGEEREELERFLAGSPRSPAEVGWWRAWLDQAAALTRQGKRISRVRVIPDGGPTGYQQWLIWADPWYADAGVDIHYLPRHRAKQIGLPLKNDWELLDGRQLIIMRFTSDGEVSSKKLITSPATVARYRLLREFAIRNAVPAARITAA